jgi:hypothetical protein
MRRSVLAETGRRWSRRLFAQALEGGAGDLLTGAWVADRAGDHDGLAGQRRARGDDGWEVFLADVQRDAEFAESLEFGASRVWCSDREAATFGPMSSTATSVSSPASAISSSEPKPARHRRVAVPSEAIGMASPAQPHPAAGVDRLDHASRGDLADAVELEQPPRGEGVEVRRVFEVPGLGQALDPHRTDGLYVSRRAGGPVDQAAHSLRGQATLVQNSSRLLPCSLTGCPQEGHSAGGTISRSAPVRLAVSSPPRRTGSRRRPGGPRLVLCLCDPEAARHFTSARPGQLTLFATSPSRFRGRTTSRRQSCSPRRSTAPVPVGGTTAILFAPMSRRRLRPAGSSCGMGVH